AINQLFGLEDIQLMHEISEIAFVTSPDMKDMGLTVMDGQFGSLMPYGKSGLLSLSSVAYTHHKVSYDNLPHFDCQQINSECRPDFTFNCNFCPAKPRSNYRKMLGQIHQYLNERVQLNYLTSFFTIKSKLKANFIDDGRPTEISCLRSNPDYFCIFAGKINSIYEIEKVV
ncbi:MAG: amino acid oxidase, partial [Bacteroidota bacterium]